MAKCLVTGGGGFIGSHLVEALLREGQQVRVLDDFSTGKQGNLAHLGETPRRQLEVVEGSITDRGLLEQVTQGVTFVFHLAALPSVQRSIHDPLATHHVCATGTLLVLEAARQAKVDRVIYAASSSAYGDHPGAVRSESDPVAPLSPYAVAKVAGEHYCRSFTKVYGLKTVRLRFFNIFGPRQDPHSPYSGVIPLFINAMSAGKPPSIDGDGLQSRDFTYVDNAVQAVVKAARAPAAVGNVYNIGNGQNTTVLGLVEQLNQLLGTIIQPVFRAPRPGDVRHSQADISLARRDLGYEPTVSFPEGLRRTIAGMRNSEG